MELILIFVLALLFRLYYIVVKSEAHTKVNKYCGSPGRIGIGSMSALGQLESVWFDGVDKKLLEMNNTQANARLAQHDDRALVTKDPLTKFSTYTKQQKALKREKIQQKNGKKKPEKIEKAKQSTSKNSMQPNTGLTDEIAMDCEMVECNHSVSVLARVSIVNLFGHPILDKYVAPPSKVTDYRTKYSGIRRSDLEGAPDFETVQNEVRNIIKGKIVVGHSIHNDFRVLKLNHPPDKIRDTSRYYKYLFQGKTPSLKKLSECILGIKIQDGEHDSVQDAQATMKLYVKERDKWNEKLLTNKANNNHNNGQKKQRVHKKMKTFYVMT